MLTSLTLAKAFFYLLKPKKESRVGSQKDIGLSSFLAPLWWCSLKTKPPKSNNDGWTLGQITVFSKGHLNEKVWLLLWGSICFHL